MGTFAGVGESFSITRGTESTCTHSDDLTVPQQAVIELSNPVSSDDGSNCHQRND
jgi:hypothetical protein